MIERFTFHAWSLTPVHIGDGSELTPESYALDRDGLWGFNAFAALAQAGEPERAHYARLLKGGDFVGAQKQLAAVAIRSGGRGRAVGVSQACRADIERVLAGQSPGKAGIRPFVRSGGSPILPGSSVKGALRTGWISAKTAALAALAPRDRRDTRGLAEASRQLTPRAMGMDPGALDQDPFRDVAVRDSPIEAVATLYDRAVLGRLDRERGGLSFDGTRGVQMHVERLESLADGAPVAPIPLLIDLPKADYLEQRKALDRRPRRVTPNEPVHSERLWAAVNAFHADLWLYERARFYPNGAVGRLLDRLLGGFGLSGGPDLAAQLTARRLVLLRLGRYSQFESKAVKLNGERYGVRAPTKGRPAELVDEGSTRTVVELGSGLHAPFGWMLLALGGTAPAVSVKIDTADLVSSRQAAIRPDRAGGRAASAPPAQAAALAGRTLFRKGDRVQRDDYGLATVARDVGLNDRQMEVIFDGETDAEPVTVAGWVRA